MQVSKLTKELCAASAPSGFEEPVFQIIKEYVEPFADETSSDAMGNFMAIKRCGQIGAKRIMLTAHMDEVGLIVTGVKDGFLQFSTLGGVDARMLPAREVRILGEQTLFGVIDTMPPHLLVKENADKAIEVDQLYIDIGLNQEQALNAAPFGTPIVFSSACEEIGEGCLCGKALDDRSCVAIVIKTFELLSARDLNVDLYCLISSQEEVGHRGAIVGTWNLQPDYAFVVDVTHAKTPDASDVNIQCGKGAVIEFGPNMNRTLTEQMIETAKEKDIPYQIGVSAGGNSGTDAQAVQISRNGVATALISLPLKYMHTPVEMVDVGDMAAIQRLLCESILAVGEVRTDA